MSFHPWLATFFVRFDKFRWVILLKAATGPFVRISGNAGEMEGWRCLCQRCKKKVASSFVCVASFTGVLEPSGRQASQEAVRRGRPFAMHILERTLIPTRSVEAAR